MARGLDKNKLSGTARRSHLGQPIATQGEAKEEVVPYKATDGDIGNPDEIVSQGPQGIFTAGFYQEDPEREQLIEVLGEEGLSRYHQAALEETAARLEFFWPGLRQISIELRRLGNRSLGRYEDEKRLITVDPRLRDYGEKEEEKEEVVKANCLTLIHEAGHAVAYQILRNRGESRSWNHELQSWYEAEDRLLKEYGISSEEIHDVSVYARTNPAESIAELYTYMFAGGDRQMPDSLRLKFARLLRNNLPEHKLLPHDENLLEMHGCLPLSQEGVSGLEKELLEKINKRKIYPVVHDGPAIIYPDGRQEWRQRGKLSRRDGPAVIHPDGSEEWWVEGMRHREDGPAIVHPDGSEAWYWQGKLHREDGPAIVHPDGWEEWRQNGKLLRRDGPAVIHPDGSEEWYAGCRLFESVGLDEDQGLVGGVRHREDGPSITRSDGSEAWYREGELHREDGPAIVHPDGREEWWLHGQEASFFEKIKIKRKQMLS